MNDVIRTSKKRVALRSNRFGEFDLDELVDRLCHSHAPKPREEDLYNAQVAILKLAEMLRAAPETNPTQPPDARGDTAIWVLAWLARKGGLGHDTHSVIDAVMEGRAVMRSDGTLHIEPRAELKANEPHEPQLVYDDELKELEPLYPDAVAFANSEARMSISKMQRKFTLGYNRAARIMERLASDGVLVFNNMTGEYRRSSSEGE